MNLIQSDGVIAFIRATGYKPGELYARMPWPIVDQIRRSLGLKVSDFEYLLHLPENGIDSYIQNRLYLRGSFDAALLEVRLANILRSRFDLRDL